MLTQQKPLAQVCAQKIWDKPTAKAQIGDYIRAPFVPVMQVIDREVLSSGQIWLLLKPTTASYAEEWVLEPEAKQPPAPQPAPQRKSTGFSGDSVGCQLRTLEVEAIQPVATPDTAPEPTPDVECESQFDLGRRHGQHDALRGWHLSYSEPVTEYATGYLAGYNAVLNPTSTQQAASLPVEWSVSLDPRWGLYQVWVGSSCLGLAATHEQAERMAQAYVANGETIKRQNRAVMKAYALGA